MPVMAVRRWAGEDGDRLRRLTEDSVKEQTCRPVDECVRTRLHLDGRVRLGHVYVAGRYVSARTCAVYLRKKYRGQ